MSIVKKLELRIIIRFISFMYRGSSFITVPKIGVLVMSVNFWIMFLYELICFKFITVFKFIVVI